MTPLFSKVILTGWPALALMLAGVNFRSVATIFASTGAAALGGAAALAGA